MTLAARLLCVCAALFAGTPAVAGEAPDVMVVTASRMAEQRDGAPAAVAVLEAGELDRIGAQHVSEALNRLAGVALHRGNGAEHLTAIRSPVLTGGAGAGSFLFLEDGVPLRAAGFANVNGLFEAADELAGRIEVVRGPGPSAYGSNALHGLVNVVTPDPRTAGVSVRAEAGSFGRASLRAMAGGATDFGAASIGLAVRHEDGWRDDASLLRTALQARADGEAGATRWSLRGSWIHLEQETATFVQGFEAFRDRELSRRNANPEAFRDARALRAALHVEHAFSAGLSANAVIHARSNVMDFRMHFLPGAPLERSGHDSIGLQSALVRDTGGTRLTAGFDAELTDGFLFEFQENPTIGPFVQGLHYDYSVTALTTAGFVQARREVSPALTLEAGARLEHTHYDYDNRGPDGISGRFLRLPDRTDGFTTFAPNAGFVWRTGERTRLFGRAARGVRAPQTTELYRLQPGQEIDGISPERMDSLELGARRALPLGGRAELAAFYMNKRNVFFRDADGFNVTDGKTRHYGAELDVFAPLAETLTLIGSVSWAIHEYAFDRPVSNTSEVIVSGARVDTAPEWLWNLRLLWTPSPRFEAEAEWAYTGAYFADAGNTARYDGHDLVHVRARYNTGGGWSVFAAVRNLADTRFAERADFAFGNFRYFPGEPRSVSAGIAFAR